MAEDNDLIILDDGQYLQCDNPDCDHREDCPHEEMIHRIDKPCPKCGENLLTEEDYKSAMAIVSMMHLAKENPDLFRQLNDALPQEVKDAALKMFADKAGVPVESIADEDCIAFQMHAHKGINIENVRHIPEDSPEHPKNNTTESKQ